MGLGKILGSISPAFGMLSGQGAFGHLPLGQLGSMGMGGILGMLLSHHGGGEDQAPQPQHAMSPELASLYGGVDPAITQASPMSGPRFGNFGGQTYLGGANPFGQNAIGRFLGGIFH